MAYTEESPLRAGHSSRRRAPIAFVVVACLGICVVAGIYTSSTTVKRTALMSDDGDDSTTGRLLSRDAIESAAIGGRGSMSSEEMAVLNNAASLAIPPKPSEDEIEAERVEREIGESRASRMRKRADAQRELDQLNEGYAKQMQRFLTGDSRVGNVVKAIDSHNAAFLANTPEFGAKRKSTTLVNILHSAEQQRSKEKRGLVPVDGAIAEREASSSRTTKHGVVWTPDGFVLKRVIGNGKSDYVQDKAPTQVLDAVDGCACAGSADEDKGPRCKCEGDPASIAVGEEWSDSEVTKWAKKKPSAGARKHTKLTQGGDSAVQKDQDPDTAAATAWAAANPPVNWGKQAQQQNKQGEQDNAVGVAAGVKKEDVKEAASEGEVKHKGKQQADKGDGKTDDKEAVSDKDQVKSHITRRFEADEMNEALQTLLERAQDGIKTPADRASFLRLSQTVKSLQDVIVRDPQSRDLTREKLMTLVGGQSLLDYANVFIMPTVDDLDSYLQGVLNDVDKTEIPDIESITGAKSAQQSLTLVLPDTLSINTYLSSLLSASYKLHSPKSDDAAGITKMAHLKETVQAVSSLADKHPQSRDLIARRLAQLKHNSQSLLDHTNVFIMPTVDDLDSYLQGILDEVAKTQVPDVESITGASDKTSFSGSSVLKQRNIRLESLLPLDVFGSDIHHTYRHVSHGEYRDKMQWQKQPWTQNEHDASAPNKVTEDEYNNIDSKMVHGDSKITKGDMTNAYGWEGESGSTAEYPVANMDGPDTKRAAAVQTQTSLNKGAVLCSFVNCYGNVSPFPPAAQRTRKPSLATVEESKSGAQAEAKPAAQVAAAPAAEAAVTKEEAKSQEETKPKEEVKGKEEQGKEEVKEKSDQGRADLGDEIFGVGVFNNENEDDVIMPSSDPSISLPYFMAHKSHSQVRRQQQLNAQTLRLSRASSYGASGSVLPTDFGVPIPL